MTNDKNCEKSDFYLLLCPHLLTAQVFPGVLSLQTNYDKKMSDKTSVLFKETAKNITNVVSEQVQDRVALSESVK